MGRFMLRTILAGVLAFVVGIATLPTLLSGSPAAASTPRRGGTLVWGISTDVTSMDHSTHFSGSIHTQLGHVFENLAQRDFGYEKAGFETQPVPILPKLATSWEWRGNDLVFHIRRGVKFHDGTTLDARAVEFNLRRWWDKKFKYYYPAAITPGPIMRFVKNVRVLDKYTIALSFEKKNWDFVDFMVAVTYWAMVSPTAIVKYGNDAVGKNIKAAIGTGPFKIVDYQPGKRFVVERFTGYWGKQPYLDRIIFRVIPDESARVAALITREVDIIDEVNPDLMDRIKATRGVTLYLRGKSISFSLLPNLSQPPFNDARVRRAASIAIDRKTIARDLLFGAALPGSSLIGVGSPIYNSKLSPPQYDPNKAKMLLAAAGYPNGFEVRARVPGAGCGMPKTVEIMEAVQSYWRAVGIKLTLEPMEWVTYANWVNANGVPKGSAYALAPICIGIDSSYMLPWLYESGSFLPNGQNYQFYSNPKLDAIFSKARTARSSDEYVRILRDEAIPIEYNESLGMAVVYGANPYGVSNVVKGWKPNRAWIQYVTRAWLER